MGPLAPLLLIAAAMAEPPRVGLVAPRGDPAPGDEVPLWIVTSDAGSPVSGLPIQISADGGTMIAQDGEVAPGIWQVRYRAPTSGSGVEFSLAAGEGKSVVRLPLRPARAPSLELPPMLTGAVGQPLTIMVKGRDLPPPDRLGVVVGDGRVERIEAVDGQLRISWAPGADPFPKAVLLGVRDLRAPDDVPAWTMLMLRARPRVPVETEPGSKVTLKVSGRAYGPFTAGADGVAQAVIEVRPGEAQAEVSLMDRAGNVQASTLALGGAAAPSLALMSEGSLVPGLDAAPLRLRAIDAEGRPWRGAEPVCTSSLGAPGPLVAEAPGSWRFDLPRLPEDAFFDVRVECAITSLARTAARIPVDNAQPARLTLRTWPDELSGDNPVAQVLVALENSLGERVPGEGITLAATLGTIQVEETPGQGSLRGLYDGAAAVAVGGDTLRATWVRPNGEGSPQDLLLAARRGPPAADGSASRELQVSARALDRRGLPLAKQSLELVVSPGGGSPGGAGTAITDASGWATVSLPAPDREPLVLEARAGGLVRRAVLWPGAELGPSPGAADLVVERPLPIRAGRVREVFLSADPPLLSAGGGEVAVVVIRLLDRAGQPVTDLIPHLEASAGTLSAPKAREDGSFEAIYTPPPSMHYGQVSLTASGAQGTPAEFRGSTTLELAPREVSRAPGVELGVLLGSGGSVTPWLSLEFEQRLPFARLPVYGRVALGTFGQHATDTDDLTGEDVDMDLRLFPVSAGVLSRAEGRRLAGWVGLSAVLAPYQLEVRLADSLVVQGPGVSQLGFSLSAGGAWRVRSGELESNLRFLTLSTGETDAGWQGSIGGVVATVGYKLLY